MAAEQHHQETRAFIPADPDSVGMYGDRVPETITHLAARQHQASELLGVHAIQHEITLNWTGVEELAAGNQHKARQLVQQAYKQSTYLPAIAGAIAQAEDPTVAVPWPGAEQIKHEHPGLWLISKGLSVISKDWTRRFDGFMERKARQRIEQIAQVANLPLQAIGRFDDPRAQFMHELADLYHDVTASDKTDPGTKLYEALHPFELFTYASYRSKASPQPVQDNNAAAKDDYPILGATLQAVAEIRRHDEDVLMTRRAVRVAAPEIIRGIEGFLRAHGQHVATTNATAPDEFLRSWVEQFGGDRLRRVPGQVESTLMQVYDLLPEDGKQFKHEFFGLCRKMSTAAMQGTSGRHILDSLIKELSSKLGIDESRV